jgi:hypothetical protein
MGEAGLSINRPIEKPREVDTWALFETEKRSGEGSPGWQPFITVPESLNSGSRGSTLLEPAHHPHTTV